MLEDFAASHGTARTLIVSQNKAAVADLITECRNLIIDFERKHDEFFLNFTKDTGMQNERPQEAPPVSYPSGGRQNYVQIPLSVKPVFDIIADTLYGVDIGIKLDTLSGTVYGIMVSKQIPITRINIIATVFWLSTGLKPNEWDQSVVSATVIVDGFTAHDKFIELLSNARMGS